MNNYSARGFTYKSELDKAINTLNGILTGIAIDKKITPGEIDELRGWCYWHRKFINKHPFSELIPLLDDVLKDNELDKEDIKDLMWFCNNLQSSNAYYDIITTDIQTLQGILHGILADNIITDEEVIGLSKWLDNNDHLQKVYPYDEVYSLVTHVLADGVITDDERDLLMVYFSEFVNLKTSLNIDKAAISKLKENVNINGICAVCPEIIIPDKVFCFTGVSSRAKRNVIADTVESLGGMFKNNVSSSTNYLVVSDHGNPCWCFSCYGRKVEKAMELRKKGNDILIVHENDFWDALEDMK